MHIREVKLPRAIIAAYAMARPARPGAEATAVRALARTIGRGRSASAVSKDIARRVVADVIAYLDMDLSDPLVATLAELQFQTEATALMALSRCPIIDTASEVLERRTALYRARGCRQLTEPGWRHETGQIAREVERKLASRYVRHLK